MVGRKDTLSETCRVEDDCLICFGCYSVQDCARHGYAVDTQSPKAKYALRYNDRLIKVYSEVHMYVWTLKWDIRISKFYHVLSLRLR